MSSEWVEVILGDVLKIQGGYAFKSKDFKPQGTAVAKIKNVKRCDIDLSDCGFVSDEIAEKSKAYLIKKGDVLICMTGSGMNAPNSIVGRVARHNGEDNAFLVNQRVGRFLIKDGSRISSRYLYYFMSPKEKQWELVAIATGSANQVNISGKQIEGLSIKLPPLPEQKAIAHILGTLDHKIELNRKMNETLEAMAQALFKSWFVDFDPVLDKVLAAGNPIPEALQAKADKRIAVHKSGQYKPLPKDIQDLFPAAFEYNDELGKWIPEGWEVSKLKDSVTIKYGKDHKKIAEGKYPCYGSGGIMRYVEQTLCETHSVLIPRKGSLNNMMYVREPFWSVDTMFFTLFEKPEFVKFLFYFLKKFNFVEMNVGSAVPSMTTKVLNEITLIIPTEPILKEFDSQVELIVSKKEANEKHSNVLIQNRDLLLSQLISGKTRLPKSFIKTFETKAAAAS